MRVFHFTKYGLQEGEDLSAEDEDDDDEEKEITHEFDAEEHKNEDDYDRFEKTPAKFNEINKIKRKIVLPIIEENDLSKEEKFQENDVEILSKQENIFEILPEINEKNEIEMDDYSDIIENFNNENTLREEEIEIFRLPDYKQEEKSSIKALNQLYSKVYENRSKNTDYYQNYSFRVSWCNNGFASFGGNKNGFYNVDINKIVIHGELYNKDEINPKYSYEKYLELLQKFNKKYKIFFKCFFDKYQFENIKDYEKDWNKKSVFIKRIFQYIHDYSKRLQIRPHNLFKNSFFKDEIFYLSLIDILFCNPSFQIIKLIKPLEKNKVSQEILENFIQKTQKISNYTLSESEKKTLLSKWLEYKAESVNILFYLFKQS